MTTVKRPSLKLRREALLALADVVDCDDDIKKIIADAPHSLCDEIEARITAALVKMGVDVGRLGAP